MFKTVQIAVPLPLNPLFTYLLPKECEDRNYAGCRAIVPFGKKILTGVITEHGTADDKTGLKSVYEIIDDVPVYSREMLELTKWISEYYLAPWGETLRAAIPTGMSAKSVIKINILKLLSDDEINKIGKKSPKRALLLRSLMQAKEKVGLKQLSNAAGISSVSSWLESFEQEGIIRCENVIDKGTKPLLLKAVRITEELFNSNEKLQETMKALDKKSPKSSVLLANIYSLQKNSGKLILLKDLTSDKNISRSQITTLFKKGIIEFFDVELDRSKAASGDELLIHKDESNLKLTAEQFEALVRITKSIDEQNTKPFLLHGITGSGKTIVYFKAIRHCLEINKSVLILVPEISLTPQLIDRFRQIFPDRIAVLHSRMSEGERYDSWRSIFNNEAKIVIGARSAIFAPLKNLGLIIIDEEHEPGYKQFDPSPRYNARDVAVYRAKLEKAAVVLGSATPSIESMFNVHSGKYSLLRISQRADGAVLPGIKIVDFHDAKKKGMALGSFTRILYDSIISRLMKKEGVILFRNRRGFSVYLECGECGFIPKCKNCDVSLTYHKYKNQLRCHYCGFTIKSFEACPECGTPELNEIGAGTQRIEEELAEILKEDNIEAKIERMDLDSTSKKGSHRNILYRFSKGETDILVGTQMVTKGLDFSRVTLVGVVNADLQLFLPDFRASERTFQLLTQVAGRAGRTQDKPGEVIIQTSHPDNRAIQAVLLGSYEMFYDEEINHRRGALYPPFSRFVYIEFSGRDESKVEEYSKGFNNLLPKNIGALQVIGPCPPTIARLKSEYRRIIIIKDLKKYDQGGKALRNVLKHVVNEYHIRYKSKSVRLTIDIDSFAGL